MSRTVLFAGGPLHGKTMAVDDHGHTVYAMEPLELRLTDLITGTADVSQPVAYALSRFAICGRMVWIGYLGTEPDDALVFEVLTSDGAKEASYMADLEISR
jgi:hypothetical protein